VVFADAAPPDSTDDPGMTIGEEITALDEVAAALRAMASRYARIDPDVVGLLAGQVGRAADRTQEVADLRAPVALLTPRPTAR